MMDRFCKWDVKKTGIFAAGVLFGTAGIKVLSSKDAKKVYVFSTAAVLRAKECIMRTVSIVRENAEDIYEEAYGGKRSSGGCRAGQRRRSGGAPHGKCNPL